MMPNGATPQSLGIQGTIVGGTNCAAAQTGNQGCGIRANSDVSFGAGQAPKGFPCNAPGG